AADAWLTALERYGTLPLSKVMAAALNYAKDGTPVHDLMAYHFRIYWDVINQWPTSRSIVAPKGTPLKAGEILVQHELARTFELMLKAEEVANGDRRTKIRAARDVFY